MGHIVETPDLKTAMYSCLLMSHHVRGGPPMAILASGLQGSCAEVSFGAFVQGNCCYHSNNLTTVQYLVEATFVPVQCSHFLYEQLYCMLTLF